MEPLPIVLIAITCVIALIVAFKLYLILTTGWDRSYTCLVGKVAIVTGSNTGIGFYTAQDFAKRGARVILACRNSARAEEARSKIIEATGNTNVVVKILDLASLSSVREFAEDVNRTEPRLDILVNNAGAGGFAPNTITADGLSMSMQINHFGPFLLTILLLGLLKKSAPSRVVVVSSDLAYFGNLNLNDLNVFPRKIFPHVFDYANSKLCNILFVNELARKTKGSGVYVNSVHPGAVQTDFLRRTSTLYKKIINVTVKCFYKETEAGAQTSIYVAVSREIEGVSGEYFVDCKKSGAPGKALNENLAEKVWEKCEELVKLTPEEKSSLNGNVKQ